MRSARAARIAGCALVVCILASCGGTATTSVTTTTVTSPKIPQSPVRAGQIDPPPGSALTSGPIGAHPSTENGVHLNVLSGLLNDQPIYDGNFADPFGLRTPNVLYIYASSSASSRYHSGANVPVIGLARNQGFAGQFLGDALPTVPRWTVPAFQWGPAVWARPDGTYVLYYSTPAVVPLGCLASPPLAGCVHTTRGRPVRRASPGQRRPTRPGPSPTPRARRSSARSTKVGPSTPACSSRPTGRRTCCGRATATAVTSPPSSIPSNWLLTASRRSGRPIR